MFYTHHKTLNERSGFFLWSHEQSFSANENWRMYCHLMHIVHGAVFLDNERQTLSIKMFKEVQQTKTMVLQAFVYIKNDYLLVMSLFICFTWRPIFQLTCYLCHCSVALSWDLFQDGCTCRELQWPKLNSLYSLLT